jgi:hypothetical protein
MSDPGKRLAAYRESVPTVTKECLQCKKPFETKFGTFCSSTCKSKHHKEQKRLEKLKELVCYFCGGPITEKRKTKFCCEEHKEDFFEAKRAGRKIAIKINPKTTVFTDKYDKIPEIIASYKTMAEDYANGVGGGFSIAPTNIGGRYISGDIW